VTRTGIASASPGRRLADLVARTAEARPESIAVVGVEESFDYATLDALALGTARRLVEAGCRSLDRVALLAPKSARTIAAYVGVLEAGGIVVPLDPASPSARQERILRSARPRCLLAGDGSAARLAELRAAGALAGLRVGWIGHGEAPEDPAPELVWDEIASAAGDTGRGGPRGADDPAQILYTSGSTGEPKGVVVRHSSVLAFVDWAVRHFGIRPGERLSCHSPLHFDLSTFDLFGAFAAGAELHLVPPELNLLPHRLAEWIRERRLTQWFSVPSVLTYLASFDAVREGDFPELERLLWCGEVFPTPALAGWMRRLPHVRFTNLYGPTETTIASSFHDVPAPPADERAPVPVGTACEGEELRVLDAELRPVAVGETGELYIGGVGLSPGYWNDPERTRAAFLPDPGRPGERIYRTGDLARLDERGRVHLVGRSDSQIKSRGYRIELGEIESALAATRLIREAVVTAVPTDGFEGHQICCAYVPAPDRPAAPPDLRRELGRLLPVYMIPGRWLTLERLPRNGSGKLDRRAILETFVDLRGATAHGPAALRPSARL
jgi:amino acid adenylation domain-containing protein